MDLRKEKDKPKKQRKKTTSKLKKELDKIFSIYVRKKAADTEGFARCYTCNTRKPINDLQCGHFISRAYLSTRFSEDNTRPQCVGCNIFGKGKTVEFASNLTRDLGKSVVARLFREAGTIVKNFPYEAKIEEYKKKVELL